jgi:hypothetical protein
MMLLLQGSGDVEQIIAILTLPSNWTSHPSGQFYILDPIEMNTIGPDQELNVLPVANHSINCETVIDHDLIEIMQLFLVFNSFYKYGAALFGHTGLLSIDK